MSKRGRPPHPDILTPREWEVLALLRESLSNDEIAQRLGISLAGAKYHVSEILGKLGVASRDEAARWEQPERPWWAGAAAPMAWMWRRAHVSWLATATAGIAAVLVVAGVALLIWGLVRTDGDGLPTSIEADSVFPTMAPTPTISTPNLPPLATPSEPYTATPIDCPGGYLTPEDAIDACLGSGADSSLTRPYVGDCFSDGHSPDQVFSARQRCSAWEDGATSPRSYSITAGADSLDRLILEEDSEGWSVTSRGGCSNQRQIETDQDYEDHGMDLSQVRIDDCRYPPEPLQRPTLRLGSPQSRPSATNGRTEISTGAVAYYPQRGVKVGIFIRNVSGETLPWTSDIGAEIELVAEDGSRFPVSEVGGTIARSIPSGLPPETYWGGWLVFPIEEFGTYTFLYPDQPDMTIDVTPLETIFPESKN